MKSFFAVSTFALALLALTEAAPTPRSVDSAIPLDARQVLICSAGYVTVNFALAAQPNQSQRFCLDGEDDWVFENDGVDSIMIEGAATCTFFDVNDDDPIGPFTGTIGVPNAAELSDGWCTPEPPPTNY